MAFFKKLQTLVDQTRTERRLGTKYVVTCDPTLIQEIHSNPEYTRSEISRRMVEHNGALGALVSQDITRARIKRPELKKFLNQKTYNKVYQVAVDYLNASLHKDANTQADIYLAIRTSLHIGFMEELLGIDYNQELRTKIKAVGLDKAKHDETFVKLFLLNAFKLPQWIKNLFAPSLKEKNEKFHQMVDIIYKEATVKPNSWMGKLKELEVSGVLTTQEVYGEIRAAYISSNTLAMSLAWAVYRLSTEHPNHIKELLSTKNYDRFAYLETLRLHPPFNTISYDKGSKCPFHRNTVYVVSVTEAHKNPLHWENPNVFWPNRFKDGMNKLKQGMFVPFGGGERICPGLGLSMHMGPKLLKFIFENYSFEDVQRPVINYSGDNPVDNNKFFAKIVLTK